MAWNASAGKRRSARRSCPALRSTRAGLRRLAGVTMAVVVFVAGLTIIEPLWKRLDRADRSADGHADVAGDLDFSAGDALRFGAALTAFMACDDAGCRAQNYAGLADATARARVSEPRRAEVRALHDLILRTVPQLEPHIHAGMLAYGPFHYRYASGRAESA